MGLIKTLSLGVGVNNKPLRKGLKSSTRVIEGWTSSVSKIAIGAAIGNLASGAISKALSTVRTSVESAFTFAIRDEQLETAFGTLLGGAAKAKRVLGDLRDFGANTPFEFPGIADSAKKLISFGFEQKQLIPTLRNLGDVAAGLDIPFADLSDIYGKARVAGKIMTEDVNQLAGRGIPIFDELARVLGVSAGDIKDLASKGKIDFGHLEQAFANMTGEGGKFSGMMAAQSKTAGGLISTLKDNINLKLGQIGAGMMKTFNIKGLIDRAIGYVQGFGPTLDWLIGQAVQLQPVFTQTYNVIESVFMGLWQAASGVFSAIGSIFGGFGSVTLKGFVRGLVTGLATVEFGFRNWQKVAQLAIKTIAFRLVAFGNSVIHLFTKQIPYVFGWFRDHGLEIAINLTANMLTLFENLGSNIVAVFSNLPGLIAGTVSFGEILTPLNDGMLEVVQHAIELPARVEGGLEKSMREDLESLQKEISGGLSDHISQRLEELLPDRKEAAAEIKPPALPEIKTPEVVAASDAAGGIANQTRQQFAQLAEAGSQEYRDAILRFRGLGQNGDNVAEDHRDIAKDQLGVLEDVARTLGAAIVPPQLFTIPGG